MVALKVNWFPYQGSKILFDVDALNVVLVLLSAFLAYIFPLELFICAYIILGPLHYLTEIKWLHDKNYFFDTNSTWLFICLLSAFAIFFPKLCFYFLPDGFPFEDFVYQWNEWTNGLILFTLLLAIMIPLMKTKTYRVVVVIAALLLAVALKFAVSFSLFIGIMIPTLIHVYVFTALFMAYGNKKSKSRSGMVSLLLLLALPVGLFFIDIPRGSYLFDDFLKNLYIDNELHHLPVYLNDFLGLSDGSSFFFYESLWIKTMMFISFAYCYHYLNWFSKTTVINWHKGFNFTSAIFLFIIYAILLATYFYDIALGLLLSLLFGFLHVFLEFPLNVRSIKALFVK